MHIVEYSKMHLVIAGNARAKITRAAPPSAPSQS